MFQTEDIMKYVKVCTVYLTSVAVTPTLSPVLNARSRFSL